MGLHDISVETVFFEFYEEESGLRLLGGDFREDHRRRVEFGEGGGGHCAEGDAHVRALHQTVFALQLLVQVQFLLLSEQVLLFVVRFVVFQVD